jgi:hypothetical protein
MSALPSGVGDYIGAATDILLVMFAVLLVRRYIRCWRARAAR